MKRQWIAMSVLVVTAIACGTARPDPNDYRTQPQSATQTKTADTTKDPVKNVDPAANPTVTGTNPADAVKKIPTETPPPAAPAAPKAAIRTLANATEIANAKTAYGTDCAGCHLALATSAKKAVTLVRLTAAGVAGAVPAHTALINAVKWPADVKDTTDDGIDTAVLKASAMVEGLK